MPASTSTNAKAARLSSSPWREIAAYSVLTAIIRVHRNRKSGSPIRRAIVIAVEAIIPALRPGRRCLPVLGTWSRSIALGVGIDHGCATERQRHVVVKQPGDAGKPTNAFLVSSAFEVLSTME
jgi:hypothetical protein